MTDLLTEVTKNEGEILDGTSDNEPMLFGTETEEEKKKKQKKYEEENLNE